MFDARSLVSRAATEITYIKTSSQTKDVTTGNNWTFELCVQSGIDVPVYVIVDGVEKHQVNQQRRSNDTVLRPTVVIAQCTIGSGRYRDAGTNLGYAINKYSPAYGETVSCLRHSTNVNNLQPYITQKDVISFNNSPQSFLVTNFLFSIFAIIKVLVLLKQ